ncbi:MAG: V-type ATP synthase subunit A, partial [Acutalibacteraceae bacterium]
PVSQATLRIVKVFWGLDANLAYKRHFPAINWLTSYSLYVDLLQPWYEKNVDESWMELRGRLVRILHDESELDEIVKLVGMDALSPADRIKMETARSIREDFLHQLAFHEVDTYTSLKKQLYMMKLILKFHDEATEALTKNVNVERLVALPVREKIGRFKYIEESNIDAEYEAVSAQIEKEIKKLISQEEV